MRGITIIIAFLACAYISAYAELPVDFFIRSEYKKDTIDYSDTVRYYYRERLAVLFSRESALNLSYIRLEHEKENKYTWNLALNDISPNAAFLLGNYFAHFGTGLLIGKKRQYEPDIFSIRINDETGTGYKHAFTPCNTGNPVFAFNGLAGALSWHIQETKLSFSLFYSIQERFINEDSYDSGKISSTLETVDAKTKDKYNHNEPIEIHTGGVMLSAEILKSILFQAYCLNTNLQSRYKEEIQWEYNAAYGESNGIAKVNGFGFFAGYKDDFLSFLIDGAMTQKEVVLNDNIRKKDYDYGILYRVGFAPPFLAMAITGKEVGRSFYSPYSSSIGEDYPESAWFFDTEIKPYTNLRLITKVSSEKKNAPSSGDVATPIIKKENIALVYSQEIIKEFKISFRRREKIADEIDDKQQFQGSTNIAITDALNLKLSATYQRNNNASSSRIFDAGFQVSLTKYLKINAHYLAAYISEDNPVYTIISPVRDSSTQGFFIKQDSNIIVLKADLKINEIFLSCRYLYQYNQSGSLYTRLEFYASGYF